MPELWKNSLSNYSWHGGNGWEMDRECSVFDSRDSESVWLRKMMKVAGTTKDKLNIVNEIVRLYYHTHIRMYCMHCQLSITLTSLWDCALHAEKRKRRWRTEGSTSGPDDPNINECLSGICTGALILALTPVFSLTENNHSGVFTAFGVRSLWNFDTFFPQILRSNPFPDGCLEDDFKPKFQTQDECSRWPCIFEGQGNKKLSKKEPAGWWKGRK